MDLLERFLGDWLGAWPPAAREDVVVSDLRAAPGWDGLVRSVLGVADGGGRWQWSVAPDLAGCEPAAARALARFEGVFRWTTSPADLEPLGTWVPHDDAAVPEWLRPFGGDVLVVLDGDGRYLAGVGLKRHLPSGWELAVGTEPEVRGRGYARRLVATAARHVLDHGAVPIYLHDDDNVASAHAASAAGIPDLGWRVATVADEDAEPAEPRGASGR